MKTVKLVYFVCPEHKSNVLFIEQVYDEKVEWFYEAPRPRWCSECEEWYLKHQCLVQTAEQIHRELNQPTNEGDDDYHLPHPDKQSRIRYDGNCSNYRR